MYELKVHFDQSSYSTVGKRTCLVYVQQMKAQSDQSRTDSDAHVYMYTYIVCMLCMCVCVCGGGGGCSYLALSEVRAMSCSKPKLFTGCYQALVPS